MKKIPAFACLTGLFWIAGATAFASHGVNFPAQKSSAPVIAPSDTGTLGGTVEDHHGVPVGGATVSVVSADSHTKRSGNTDGTGSFFIDSLPAGDYMVTASARGLLPKTEKARIKEGRRTTLHIKLKAPPVYTD
ncbi:MAG TPA: carboxypeptidase-like regulatory domain-containing protein [Verrucomicrobiae bacterium]|nr:carboxypeptidase-like regulatory domain-containing protein [Verrucomicrobiae bacterium]